MYYIKSLVKWNYLILLLANSVNYGAAVGNQESQISLQNIAQLVSPTTLAWDMLDSYKDDELIDRKCSLFINYCKNHSVDVNTLVGGKSFIYRALNSVYPKKWLLAVLEAGADPNYFFTEEPIHAATSFVKVALGPLIIENPDNWLFTPLDFIGWTHSLSLSKTEDTPWSRHGSSSLELCRILLEGDADSTKERHQIIYRENAPREVKKLDERINALESLIENYNPAQGKEYHKDLVKLFAIWGGIGSRITQYKKNDMAIFAIKEAIDHHTKVREFLLGEHDSSYCASLPRELRNIIADYLPKVYGLQKLLKEVE